MANSSSSYPPFSRLFIIGDKTTTEESYQSAFGEFGTVCSTQFIKERNGDNKGIVYIQMSKTSEAVKAVQALNGKCIADMARSMKVLIATNKSDSSTSDEDIMNQISRLFVLVPKTDDESKLHTVFEKYGRLAKVVIVRDKETKQSKGLAYITFGSPFDAAIAYEECDQDYKPKFAQPYAKKRQYDEYEDRSERRDERYDRRDRHSERPRYDRMDIKREPVSPAAKNGPAEFLATYPHSNQFYLKVRVPKGLTQNQLTRLFNIVPTLEFCRHMTNQYRTTDLAVIGFSSAGCCAYAREAFNGFEYPPGCPLEVDFYVDGDPEFSGGPPLPPNIGGSGPWQSGAAGGSRDIPPMPASSPFDSSHGPAFMSCSPASSHASRTHREGECKKRLFIVSQPEKISPSLLSDMFSKFGNFLSFNYLPGKNCGFAMFSSEETADMAQRYMHGEMIEGNKLKCLEAEEKPPEQKKSRV